MSGLPLRPSRQDYGPDPVNTRPVRDPSRELDGETIGKLMLHQLAGLGAVTARAWLTTRIIAGPDVELASRAEGWNPNDVQTSPYTPPTVVRAGPGEYTVDYQSEYPDQDGTLQPLVVSGMAVKILVPSDQALTSVYSERADLAASPPVGIVRINVKTYGWQIGSSTDWGVADLGFFLAIW